MKTLFQSNLIRVGAFLLFTIMCPTSALATAGPLLGDANFDGEINLLDVEALLNTIVSGNYNINADVNMDGVVDLRDVSPFVEILIGSKISPIKPKNIEGFHFVPSSVGGGDDFQFIIRFDNHEPKSIIPFDRRYVRTFIRVRNTVTDQVLEDDVITYSIDVMEDGSGDRQETVGLVNARMVIDWVFLSPEDFGPNGDYVVELVRINLSVPSFKDVEGNNIVGTVVQKGF